MTKRNDEHQPELTWRKVWLITRQPGSRSLRRLLERTYEAADTPSGHVIVRSFGHTMWPVGDWGAEGVWCLGRVEFYEHYGESQAEALQKYMDLRYGLDEPLTANADSELEVLLQKNRQTWTTVWQVSTFGETLDQVEAFNKGAVVSLRGTGANGHSYERESPMPRQRFKLLFSDTPQGAVDRFAATHAGLLQRVRRAAAAGDVKPSGPPSPDLVDMACVALRGLSGLCHREGLHYPEVALDALRGKPEAR